MCGRQGRAFFAHKHPQAFHSALGTGFHLYGEDIHIGNGDVIDFGLGIFGVTRPEKEFVTDIGRLVAQHLEACDDFCDAPFVDEVGLFGRENIRSNLRDRAKRHIEKPEHQAGVKGHELTERWVGLPAERQAVGVRARDSYNYPCEQQKVDSFLNFIPAIACDLGI